MKALVYQGRGRRDAANTNADKFVLAGTETAHPRADHLATAVGVAA
jgi:hypothetical protein